jgi:hypothetical protein
VRAELDRQGLLWPHERELLIDAADALFFDEPGAASRAADAAALLRALEANGRRTAGEAQRLRAALEGCGGALPAAA